MWFRKLWNLLKLTVRQPIWGCADYDGGSHGNTCLWWSADVSVSSCSCFHPSNVHSDMHTSSVHDTVLHTACRINPPRTDASLKFGAPNFYVVDNCWQPWCCTQNHKWGGVSYPVVEPSLLSKNIETETWHGYKWRFLKTWGIPKSPWLFQY